MTTSLRTSTHSAVTGGRKLYFSFEKLRFVSPHCTWDSQLGPYLTDVGRGAHSPTCPRTAHPNPCVYRSIDAEAASPKTILALLGTQAPTLWMNPLVILPPTSGSLPPVFHMHPIVFYSILNRPLHRCRRPQQAFRRRSNERQRNPPV